MLTYNREHLIGRAMESILNQTFQDYEFIVIDNGSTDCSGLIADGYAERDGRIRVIHRTRGNIGSGRNVGLEAANGEYIAFIDDDDWAEPDFLMFLYDLAVNNSADVAICGAADKVFNEKHVMSAEDALIQLMWRKWYNAAFPTKLFSRELAKKIKFSEEDKYDDISQMYKLLAFTNRVAYHGLPKYTFYRHTENNSAWTTNHELLTSETLGEYLRAYGDRTKWLCALFPNNVSAWRYFEWSFMISMIEKINRFAIKGCEKYQILMMNQLQEHRNDFLSAPYILEYEKEWIDQYIR